MGRSKYYTSPSKRIKNLKRVICHIKSRVLILEQLLADDDFNVDMKSSLSFVKPRVHLLTEYQETEIEKDNFKIEPSMLMKTEQSLPMKTEPLSPPKLITQSQPFSAEDFRRLIESKFENSHLDLRAVVKSEMSSWDPT